MKMPRIAGLVVKGEPAVYHVVSRTAVDGFVLGDVEKGYLLDLIKRLSSVDFSQFQAYSRKYIFSKLSIQFFAKRRYNDEVGSSKSWCSQELRFTASVHRASPCFSGFHC